MTQYASVCLLDVPSALDRPFDYRIPEHLAGLIERGSRKEAILTEAGLTMANVVKTVIFLADINDFAAVNAEYAKAFAEPFPARSCVQVAAIPKGAKLEIECIAVRG